jgi:hypothetical protein
MQVGGFVIWEGGAAGWESLPGHSFVCPRCRSRSRLRLRSKSGGVDVVRKEETWFVYVESN